jgi:UDP:flavonoid glycosyltransferase YjiC (YdhE family)
MSHRFLFTSIGTTGRLHPLLPYADAARAAGHEVAFATPPVATPAVKALGFAAFSVGKDSSARESVQLAGFSLDGLSVEEQMLLMGRYWTLGDHLIERVRDLVELGSWWRPDVIIREEIEYAGCLAAELLDVPDASIKASANVDLREIPARREVLLERFGVLRLRLGLPPDPELAMPFRYLEVWPFPRSFRIGPYPASTCRPSRPVPFDQAGPEGLPAWVDDLPPRDAMARVYVTLGTTGDLAQHVDVFATILPGLRDERYSLIVTVGRDIDPTRFGPQPANVHVEQYIPQTLLFPYCDLVVCHGGSGTVLSALDHGLPQVMIPLTADQPFNARHGTDAGYALTVTPNELTPESIRVAVGTVCHDPGYRAHAERIQDEIHSMPGPDQVVAWFTELAREG